MPTYQASSNSMQPSLMAALCFSFSNVSLSTWSAVSSFDVHFYLSHAEQSFFYVGHLLGCCGPIQRSSVPELRLGAQCCSLTFTLIKNNFRSLRRLSPVRFQFSPLPFVFLSSSSFLPIAASHAGQGPGGTYRFPLDPFCGTDTEKVKASSV